MPWLANFWAKKREIARDSASDQFSNEEKISQQTDQKERSRCLRGLESDQKDASSGAARSEFRDEFIHS